METIRQPFREKIRVSNVEYFWHARQLTEQHDIMKVGNTESALY